MEGMARQDPEFGRDHGLIHEVIVTGRKVGADRSFWAELAHNRELFGKVVDLVNSSRSFPVIVDYTLSLHGMIVTGKYDRTNPDITAENFPVSIMHRHEITIEIFHFNRSMESDDVLVEMDKQGYRPATIEELLALGAQYPEEQEKYPIIALGSVSRNPSGGPFVPCLWVHADGRTLLLDWFGLKWNPLYRFIAVRK